MGASATPAPGSQGRSFSRADKAFACVTGAACLWLLAERLRIPLLPFVLADSGSYLAMAIQLTSEGEFIHVAGRQFAYPLFLAGVIRIFGDIRAISLVQHGLGVLGALLLLLAWLRIPLPRTSSLPGAGGFPWVHRGAGLLLLLAQGLNAQTIVYEHHIQPEAISQAVGSLMLFALAVAFALDPRHHPGRFVGWTTVGLFAANLLALLRPQALLVVPATGLCVLAFALARRTRPAPLLASVAVPAALSLLLLWGPEVALVRSDPAAATISAKRFLFWHFHIAAPVIREQLEAPGEDPDDPLRRKLLDAYAAERERHAAEGRWYRFQGYNPCALYYREAGKAINEHFAGDDEALEAFSMEAFFQGVRARPSAYLAKIGNNLATYYRLRDKIVPNPRAYVKMRHLLENSTRVGTRLQHVLDGEPAWAGYVTSLESLAADWPASRELVWILGSEALSDGYFEAYRLLGLAATPALLALAGALALSLVRSRPTGFGDTALAWTAATSAIALFASLLTASMLHGLETHRYMLALTNQALFSTFTAGWLVVHRARVALWPRRWTQAGRRPEEPAPSRPSR